MNSRLFSGLVIVAISATTGAANAAHVPLTKFHHSEATSFAHMHRVRSNAGSGAGPSIVNAPIGGVSTINCYGVGESDLARAALNPGGAPFGPVANSTVPPARAVGRGHDFSAALRGFRFGNWYSDWADAATTDSSHSPTNSEAISVLRPANSHAASHFANVLVNAAGSSIGTRKLGGKWRKTGFGAYPIIEAETPSNATPPCPTPSDDTLPDSYLADSYPPGLDASDSPPSDPFVLDLSPAESMILDVAEPHLPDSYLPDSYAPGLNDPNSSPLDPSFLDLPQTESMIPDMTEPEMTFPEESRLLQSSPNAIPEPGSIVLLAIGLGALAGLHRRRTVD